MAEQRPYGEVMDELDHAYRLEQEATPSSTHRRSAVMSEVEGKPVAWLGFTKSGAFFAHFADEAGAADGRSMGLNVEAVYSATTLASLQSKLEEKDREIAALHDAYQQAAMDTVALLHEAEATAARLQAERDGDVAKAVEALKR